MGRGQPYWARAKTGSPLQHSPDFCFECGSKTLQQCERCSTPIVYQAKYCGGCGQPHPWTETGLAAARALTEESGAFSPDEKVLLNDSFKEITSNTPATPLAASRLRTAAARVGPQIGTALLEILKTKATSEAKKHMGRYNPHAKDKAVNCYACLTATLPPRNAGRNKNYLVRLPKQCGRKTEFTVFTTDRLKAESTLLINSSPHSRIYNFHVSRCDVCKPG